MKTVITVLLVTFILVSCVPTNKGVLPETIVPTSTAIIVPTKTITPTSTIAPTPPFLLEKWDLGSVFNMAWNPNSKMFLVYSRLKGKEVNSIQAFSVESLDKIWSVEKEGFISPTFSPNKQQVVESSWFDNSIELRNTSQGDVVGHIDNCKSGRYILSRPEGSTFLIAANTGLVGLNIPTPDIYVSLLDLDTGLCSELFHYEGYLSLFDVNSTGNLIALGGTVPDGLVILNLDKQTEVCHTKDVDDYGRFIPNQNILAISVYQKVVFIDALSCKKIREIIVGPVSQGILAFSPNGELFAIAEPTMQKSIQIVETVTGKTIYQIPLPENSSIGGGYNNSLMFSPDGRYLLFVFSINGNDIYADEVGLWQLQK